jgi:NitT/TauT family transport system ATP-binding protein
VPDPLLIADGVTLTYPSGRDVITATYRVDFEVFAGDSYILLGPSGCGKSSLLKAVGGYLPTTEGRISLNGREIRTPGPDRMMVFQEFDQLLPWRTVKQNVMFPMRATGKWNRAESAERADAFLAMVGLAKFRDAYPHTLSGGMKQRAAIARGMAMEPAILLMDEPFAALDSMTRLGMQDELLRLREQTGCTLLFVTHSIAEAIKIGSRILLLSAHPGRVRAEINNVQRRLREPDGAKRLEAQIYELLFGTPPQAAAA